MSYNYRIILYFRTEYRRLDSKGCKILFKRNNFQTAWKYDHRAIQQSPPALKVYIHMRFISLSFVTCTWIVACRSLVPHVMPSSHQLVKFYSWFPSTKLRLLRILLRYRSLRTKINGKKIAMTGQLDMFLRYIYRLKKSEKRIVTGVMLLR